MVRAGKNSAQILTRARILLKAAYRTLAKGGATAPSRLRWTPASTMSLARVSNWSPKRREIELSTWLNSRNRYGNLSGPYPRVFDRERERRFVIVRIFAPHFDRNLNRS